MASAKWSLDIEDMKKIIQAVAYSAISAGLAGAMVVVSSPNALSWKAIIAMVIVPAVNGALVALKKWVDGEPFTPPSQPQD